MVVKPRFGVKPQAKLINNFKVSTQYVPLSGAVECFPSIL